METVQLQCGGCGKLMAISTEHLGGQVRCPHCQTVVQTPPRPSPAPPEIGSAAPGEVHDSIFSPPEPSDDVFDAGPSRPFVEMPPEPPLPVETVTATFGLQPPETSEATEATEVLPAPQEGHPDDTAAADLSALKAPRPVYDKSLIPLLLLIFFVPYSVLTTLFVIYLWYQLVNQPHPLDFVPDPVPAAKKGGAREVTRIKPDQPLADHQKVALGKTVRVGEAELTPQKVILNAFGDLELHVRVKNVSAEQAFSPMSREFLAVLPDGKGGEIKPYSFVESASYKPIYCDRVHYQRPGDDDLTGEGDLRPGQEEEMVVTTKGSKQAVERVTASAENLTWRIQVRRGLVKHRGQFVSATAVVGVRFSAKNIERAAG
jgi:hypothetical protein